MENKRRFLPIFTCLLFQFLLAGAGFSHENLPSASEHPPRQEIHANSGPLNSLDFRQMAGIKDAFDKAHVLFLVTANTWLETRGVGQVYRKNGLSWEKFGSSFVVSLGRAGLGWGRGIIDFRQLGSANKSEGDGRSPAGIFRLNTAFGKEQYGNFPMKIVTDKTICVDDSQSTSYNRIFEADSRPIDWDSYEKMDILLYRYGIEVAHNFEVPEFQGGSCIFIHLANESMGPTSGCTALAEKNLKFLLDELDETSLFIQMPVDQVGHFISQFIKL